MRRVVVVATMLAACGRFGFEPSSDGARGDDAGTTTPLGGVRSIAARPNVSCAVLDDRSLWCWGDASSKAIGTPVTEPFVPGTRVGADVDWAEVAVGGAHACAIKTDGSLWCWGDAYAFGGGSSGSVEVAPVRVEGPSDWTAISIGAATCGIHEDASLTCFGPGTAAASAPQVVPGRRFTRIDETGAPESFDTMCAIEDTGVLWCWGCEAFASEYLPAPVGADTWSEVAVGSASWLAVRSDGTLWRGVLGGDPVLMSGDDGWTGPAMGVRYGCAVKDGALWCFGENPIGQHGDAHDVTRPDLAPIDAGVTFAHLSTSGVHTCASRDGVLSCTGLGTRGQLGDGVSRWSRTAQLAGTWAAVDVDSGFGVALAANGATSWWGEIGRIQTAPRGSPGPVPTFAATMIDVGVLWRGALGVRDDGTLWLWGRMLDDVDHVTPVQIGSASTWLDVDGGETDACGLQVGGTLWCWGTNRYGSVGDGSTTPRSEPVQISATTWRQISVGAQGACGIQSDDTLWCWGLNIGDMQGSSATTPRRVDTTSWARVSVGTWRTCAITTGGELNCWEDFGTIGYPSRPTAVDAATDWARVSAGWYHACAVKTDGSLWCWGDPAGYVGDGPIGEHTMTPQRIGTDTDWAEVSAGEDATCARKTSGAMSCWGSPMSIGDGLAWSTHFVPVRGVDAP